MARPRKEDQAVDTSQELQDNELQATDAPQLGYNKEYVEYQLEVKAKFKDNPWGGQYLHKYTGEILKKKRDGIRIEDFRAEQLNRQWYNTKSMLLEAGDTQTTFEIIIKD